MHWVQEEKPVEYHVVRWENSAFHNHDKRPERKMLGGVSFDGGAGGGKSANIQQTGVQTAQPSFSHPADGGWFGNGIGESGKSGAHGVRGGRDTVKIRTVPKLAAADNVLEAARISVMPEEKRSRPFIRTLRKMGSGIQAFLREMEQKAGQRKDRKCPKKKAEGTRTAAKEEFDRIEEDKSYLLDSYNKYGERSTLGR